MSDTDDLKNEDPKTDTTGTPALTDGDESISSIVTDEDTPQPTSGESDKRTDTRFRYTTIEPLDFLGTSVRYRELNRMLQILQAPIMNVPLLVVDNQEDILPLLSLCVHECVKNGKKISFYSVTPADFDMNYGDGEVPYEVREKIRNNIGLGGSVIENGDDDGAIPVYCDITAYDNWDLMAPFVKNCLEIDKDAIILCRRSELSKIQQLIQDDRNASNGVEKANDPYSKGLARASELTITPLTNDEKYIYFSHHFARLLFDSGLGCSENVGNYLLQETMKRCTPETVFTKTFEVMDKAISIAVIDEKESISRKIATRALNEKLPLHNRTKALADMDVRLKKKIFGQDQAIEQCYETILAQLDDTHRDKPTVLAFFGPSGVGKTALAEEISLAVTGKKITTINMAEYADSFKVSILTGSSKGYVDSDEDGLLAKIVRENPNAVILLDEFEKAHPRVQQMFLGIFDKGSVFDNHSGLTNMSKTTIILTSNAGVRPENAIGFARSGEVSYIADEHMVKNAFPNELLGRLNAKIFFHPLSEDVLKKIVDKFMNMLKPRFDQLGVRVSLSKTARQELVEKAKDPASGARPLMALMRQKIKVPVELGIIRKEIKHGNHVVINSITDSKKIKLISRNTMRQDLRKDNERIHT